MSNTLEVKCCRCPKTMLIRFWSDTIGRTYCDYCWNAYLDELRRINKLTEDMHRDEKVDVVE